MGDLVALSLGVLSLAAGAMAVRWPFAAALAYLWLDFMRPQDAWPALAAARPMLALAVGMLLAALRESVANPAGFRLDAETWRAWSGVVALCAAVVPSSLVRAIGSESATAHVGVALAPIKLALVAWLITRALQRRRDFDLAILVIAVSLTALALMPIWQGIGVSGAHVAPQGPGGAGVGLLGDNNDLARGMLFGLTLWSAFAATAPPSRRVVALLAIALVVEGVVFTGSRGGFIALVVTGSYLLFSHLRPLPAALASLALLLAPMSVAAPAPITKRMATIAKPTAQASVQSRVDIWHEGLRRSLARPVFGHGIGTFAVPHAKGPEHPPRSSHNIFVELFYETGAIGLAAYLFLLAQTFARLRVLRAPPSTEPWLRSRAIALEAALIAFTVASLGLSHPFQSTPFVTVALAIALRRSFPLPRPRASNAGGGVDAATTGRRSLLAGTPRRRRASGYASGA